MKIDFVEIRNFRKLKSTHIDFDEKRTLFVGANNSGKTSAIVALRTFLLKPQSLTLRDISIGLWRKLDAVGKAWEQAEDAGNFDDFLPCLDLWLDVPLTEIHRVVHILPTIDWDGGRLGVRLQFMAADPEKLRKDYLEAHAQARATEEKALEDIPKPKVRPACLSDFLEQSLSKHVTLRAFPLDPSQYVAPDSKGVALPQVLPASALPLGDKPFRSLIAIDDIPAQRDMVDAGSSSVGDGDMRRVSRRLSDQVRSYHDQHLENAVDLTADDVAALSAMQSAERAFDGRLKSGFDRALTELASLGVPGVNNPSITFNTQLKGAEGLKHSTAIQYKVVDPTEGEEDARHLPESYAGLGYQNLISMVFMLMRFREDWMATRSTNAGNPTDEDYQTPLLQLVLIEEPEAHLHAQVQQVFINKAYDVLRNHERLGEDKAYNTQLVVSSHSSHVAHEVDFANLRYFRRHTADTPGEAPTSTVANLSNTFGEDEKTYRFVKRYLEATHCDLFFADAAIFVEGQAERILIPHFICHHFPVLWRRYTSLINIGGAHAHTLEPLVRDLGLTVLVISDIDSAQPTEKPKEGGGTKTVNVSAPPMISQGQVTTNSVLKSWYPKLDTIDALVAVEANGHHTTVDDAYDLYVAYQKAMPDPSDVNGAELIPRTFEDALVYENYKSLSSVSGGTTTSKIADIVNSGVTGAELEQKLFDLLKKAEKAGFALDCLTAFEEPNDLRPPRYIADGLAWLEMRLAETAPDALQKTSANG